MKRSIQKGFTLIELMIVVAIVGILAAIAIPAYKDFTVRSRVSEVLASMAACKTKLEDFYQSNSNQWTNSAGAAVQTLGLCNQSVASGNNTKFLTSMTVTAGPRIDATTSAAMGDVSANSLVITMFPADAANALVAPPANINRWICGGAGTTVVARFRPGSCQG
jgi:type IV pilus assembly protein PilA